MLYIVIPNYNGKHHLKDFFDSLRLQTYTDFKSILVDNSSSDGSISFVNKNYPEVFTLSLKSNSGFARGVNEGIKFALQNPDCKNILLLNNDMECDKNFVKEMIDGLDSKDVFSVCCKVLKFYDRNVIDHAGLFIKFSDYPVLRGHNEIDNGQYDKRELIFGASGGGALYKKEVFEKIGFFDEDFFAYHEDIDLNMRLQWRGMKCLYNPLAVVYHKGGSTSSKIPGLHLRLSEKNFTALIVKNYPLVFILKYYFPRNFNRWKFYFGKILKGEFREFMFCLLGMIQGIIEIPSNLTKRRQIMSGKLVSNDYLLSCELKK